MKVYADNAATTKMCHEAREAMIDAIDNIYGNPSSLHSEGQRAKLALEEARKTVSECIGAAKEEIYFTSGGSESDNQAIISAAEWGQKHGRRHIISDKTEHHAVLNTLRALEKKGFEVTFVEVDKNGVISPDNIKCAMREDTALVTVMSANNEIGTIEPVSQIGAMCRERNVVFHTDAVQAAGYIPLDRIVVNSDFVSLSAHKFHGPKGVGVLYASKGSNITKLIEGGGQERDKRAGTENVPGIVSCASALKAVCNNMMENVKYIERMRDRLISGLLSIPGSTLNGSVSRRLPGNVNIRFSGINGEALLNLLDMHGIFASSGSACTEGDEKPSHVLKAIGLTDDEARSSVRFSLSKYNTIEEVEYIIKQTGDIIYRMREANSDFAFRGYGNYEKV